jgi:hypothetical protein
MRCRERALIAVALAVGLFVPTGTAWAHRLEADYRVLADQKVEVEGWYDLGGLPKGARVQVFRPDGSLLAEGKLDGEARFLFSYGEAVPLKVVVSSAGHRKELDIPAGDLTTGATAAPSPGTPDLQATAGPRAEHSSGVSVKDVLVGVGFLLALAAFVLSVRNARRLRDLERRSRG